MSGVLLAGFAFGGIVRRFDVSLDGGLLKKNATDARLGKWRRGHKAASIYLYDF